jgi:uncharacterized protein involved in type VI secretion and phage assembly
MTGSLLARGLYAVAEWWRAGVHLGIVTSVQDPESKGRVQVRLPAIDPNGDAPIWARVAVPFAGDNFGAFLIPDVGSEVLVAFVAGDAGWPVVIGNFWNGATGMPDSLPSDKVDRWTFTGKNGTRIAIVEEQQGQEKVEIELPSGAVKATLTDANGGEVEIKAAANTVKLSSTGVSIDSPAKVEVKASSVSVTASTVTVDAGMSSFSGVVKCDTVISNSVVATTYTPGAGNIW